MFPVSTSGFEDSPDIPDILSGLWTISYNGDDVNTMWYAAGSLMLHSNSTSPLTAQPSTTFHHHPIELSIALEQTV
ncbi:hypothetical protein AZE42_12465 [Rhizopogon vesiculosus]|uniref:Uncharacterized protein n=1 Tax=Rhizopogon vesiculosus TaxID=180088 RepID=A0A1J8QEM1_9AGAM|nr:hypothetical protein AZE42_12465 [Rhizopogon vesiculosus]